MVTAMSRTQLNHQVNLDFWERFPEAPRQLSASSKPEWRAWWIERRDHLLNEEVNRVYWARYPDAPKRLDATSPEWEPWREKWNAIWQEVMGNCPEPEDAGIVSAVDEQGNLDLSYLKAAIREQLLDREIQPDILDEVIAAADRQAEALVPLLMQEMHEIVHHPGATRVEGRGGHWVDVEVQAWWGPGYVSGFVGTLIQSEGG